MAKATAKCICINCRVEFTKEKKCYSRREADSWEQWAKGNYTLCEHCYRAQEVEKAKEATGDLPELTGTQKQTDWAIQIRAKMVKDVDATVARLGFKAGMEDIGQKVVEHIKSQSDSRYWIDNRFKSVPELMAETMKKMEEDNQND